MEIDKSSVLLVEEKPKTKLYEDAISFSFLQSLVLFKSLSISGEKIYQEE